MHYWTLHRGNLEASHTHILSSLLLNVCLMHYTVQCCSVSFWGSTEALTFVCSSQCQEWVEMVEARVCTADTWRDGLGAIWRGSLHFTEQRVR